MAPFWDDLSHRIKVASSEGDLTGKIREQLGRFPSAKTGTGFSLGPVISAACAAISFRSVRF